MLAPPTAELWTITVRVLMQVDIPATAVKRTITLFVASMTKPRKNLSVSNPENPVNRENRGSDKRNFLHLIPNDSSPLRA